MVKFILILIAFLFIFHFADAQEKRPLDAYFFGVKALKTTNIDSAAFYFMQCVDEKPNEIEYLKSLGLAYFKNNEFKKSIHVLTKINSLKYFFADFDLVKCYAELGEYDSAFYFLESHLKSRYKKYESEIKLDSSIRKLYTQENWNLLWKNEWYTSYEHQLADVKYNISIKNYELAQSILNDIFAKRSNPHEALYLSAVLNKEQTFFHAALTEIDAAIDKRKTIEDYHFLKAELLIELDKNAKALQSINRALELNMYNLNFYKTKALILNNIEEFNEAITYYRYYLKFTDYGYKELFFLSHLYYKANENINA